MTAGQQQTPKYNKAIKIKKRHLVGSMIGNACEWYDYVVYGSLAPILSIIFFPKDDRIVGLMLTFAIFAAGFLVRPIGGVIFGNIADKYGRKNAFIYSILLVAVPALAIGFLPGYNAIGRSSPFLLLIFRLLQGIAVGGEYPTMITYIAELSPPKRRGYIGSYANVTTVTGVLLATITVAIVTKCFSHEQLVDYGWRIPFFITFLTILFGYYIRRKLPESIIFLAEEKLKSYPVVEAIKNNKSEIIKIFASVVCIAIAYYTFNVFSTTYFIETLKLNYLTALYISIASILLLIILLPIAGHFSDLYGRKKLVLIAILSMIIFIYPVYIGFEQKILWLALASQFIFAFLIALYLAPLPAIMVEQVGTKIRCSSIAIGYNLALAIFGGTAPVVNLYIIKHFNSAIAPSIYLIISGIVSLIAALFMKDLTGKKLL